ncbi:protein-tyrosine phosphatase [Clostridium cavendishii DSM 21758]|uniref:protein-tyrosine-phosphatase n=1 Tax=Clostridium cavendishii DSM 21758 TaxID=1121302 RepID=A0A1M6KR68_9CLOT|nr:CpsB/CapC family capsule biosynthesis tyrosine phosphatase [Clostridium cavendishii]SHJ61437.1 protein-tyrosine phosphatase [Clostridium cavendishii DSM 21758]
MVDFHSHIVFNVDDGSSDIAMSKNMILNAIDEGTKCICASSHYIPIEFEQSKEEFFEKVDDLRQIFSEKIDIVPALEVYLTPDLIELYEAGKIWCINEKKYMLIELPMSEFPMYTEDVFYELRLKGITPIIAHPERNIKIAENINLLKNLIEQGVLAQMNSGSILGFYGKRVKEVAETLIQMNLIHVLGSDAHNDGKRNTNIKTAFNRINEINPDLYEWIIENQFSIINGDDVEVLPIKKIKKAGFLARMFKR